MCSLVVSIARKIPNSTPVIRRTQEMPSTRVHYYDDNYYYYNETCARVSAECFVIAPAHTGNCNRPYTDPPPPKRPSHIHTKHFDTHLQMDIALGLNRPENIRECLAVFSVCVCACVYLDAESLYTHLTNTPQPAAAAAGVDVHIYWSEARARRFEF